MKLVQMLKELKQLNSVLYKGSKLNGKMISINPVAKKLTYIYNTNLYQKIAHNPIDQKQYGHIEEFKGQHLVGRTGFEIQPKQPLFKMLKDCLRNTIDIDFDNPNFLSLLKFTNYLMNTNFDYFSFKTELDLRNGKIFSIDYLTPLDWNQLNHLTKVMLKNVKQVAVSLGV